METQEAMAYDRAIEYARNLGAERGANAAGWYAQDAFGGRVTRGARESAARVLAGIEDGDPAVMDTLPSADLSGEWADSLTGPQLISDALAETGIDPESTEGIDLSDRWGSDICDAYEDAFAQAAEDEVARLARLEASAISIE